MTARKYHYLLLVLMVLAACLPAAKASAAQYFTDFSEYTTGAAPSGWTKTRDLGTATWSVEAVAGAGGGKVLRGDNATTNYSLFTWDTINSDVNRANSEVVIKWRTTTLQDNSTAGIGALVRAQTDFTNGYQAWTRNQATSQLALQKNSGFNLGNTNFSWSNNTWYLTRLRANGTSIQVKSWADGSSEPGTWSVSATDSGLADGPVGVAISNATGVYEIDYIGVGTNGDTAPTSAANSSPAAPSADGPSNGATSVSVTPIFTLTSSDPDSDALQYKVTIYSDSGCSSVVQTNSQSSSQTGWSGQDTTCSSGSDCYNSGTQGTYQVQSSLSYSTTYYWKASAKDPLGTNSFTDGASCSSFTTASNSFPSGNTNISAEPAEHWAWNDVVGWMDFYITDNVNVLTSKIQGYASSSAGWISMDCGTSPGGSICGTSDYKVANDGEGRLKGWAWNDTIGWISFCGGQDPDPDCPGSITYRVQIDPATGDFSGWAWNDAVGWISFNCADTPDNCATSSFKVRTSWVATSTSGYLDSSTFDTGVSGGAKINSVVWQGSLPSPANGASVAFQFAVSNSSTGPWDYEGPDGTANTYYTTSGPNDPYILSYTLHNDKRYFRYRITLTTNQTQTSSPLVESVSVNWSR